MKISKKPVTKLLTMTIMLSMLICLICSNPIHADELNLEITIDRGTDKNDLILTEEVTSNYSIEPQPIPKSVPNTKNDKEIVLVIDISRSMDQYLFGQTRIAVAKQAAQNFINSIEGYAGVKVAIVLYGKYAHLEEGLTSNFDDIREAIDGLGTRSGTNIGDGLRWAYYALKNGNVDAEKYIVMLSDGEPTYHSLDRHGGYFLSEGAAERFNGIRSKDKEYGEKVVDTLINPENKTMDILTYMIAFTSEADSNVMKNLANKAGGVYKKADDAEALNGIYEDISNDIISDFTVPAVTFEEVFPDGFIIQEIPEDFTADGQKVTADLGAIRYNYDNDLKQYKADSINFEIKLKAITAGDYTLGESNSSILKYKDGDGNTCTKYFPEADVCVSAFGKPKLEVKNISRTGETSKVEFEITLPEYTEHAELWDENGVILEGFDNITASGTYYLEGLSIYKTYKVRLWAKGDSGESNQTDLITILKAIDIN